MGTPTETLPAICMDFYGDWIDWMRAELVRLGYAIPLGTDQETVALYYFMVRRKLVQPMPRAFHRARGLKVLQEDRAGLALLQRKVENGANIIGHLSTGISSLVDSNGRPKVDGLLSHWGIHHFHLGTGAHAKRRHFVARTKRVLLALVTDADFHAVAILPHGKNVPSPWINESLVETVHANWPATIERYILRGVLPTKLKQEHLQNLRDKNVNVSPEVNGTVYAPLGGGVTSSGFSLTDVMDLGRRRAELKGWEDSIVLNQAMLLAAARNLDAEASADGWHFRLEPGTPPRAVDKARGVAVELLSSA